jgi:hypothetical protein
MSKPRGTCHNSHKCSEPSIGFCGICKVTAYCSMQCQRDSWPDHKLLCQSTYEERLVALINHKIERGYATPANLSDMCIFFNAMAIGTIFKDVECCWSIAYRCIACQGHVQSPGMAIETLTCVHAHAMKAYQCCDCVYHYCLACDLPHTSASVCPIATRFGCFTACVKSYGIPKDVLKLIHGYYKNCAPHPLYIS